MNQFLITSPLGNIICTYSDLGISKLCPLDSLNEDFFPANNDFERLIQAKFNDYFAGILTEFNLPLDLSSGTVFQQKVWNDLLKISFGTTKTYGEIAEQIGHPKAFQAVGGAVGDNPVAILIPCHRVLGKNGKLTGFRWGLDRKKELLNLEKIQFNGQ